MQSKKLKLSLQKAEANAKRVAQILVKIFSIDGFSPVYSQFSKDNNRIYPFDLNNSHSAVLVVNEFSKNSFDLNKLVEQSLVLESKEILLVKNNNPLVAGSWMLTCSIENQTKPYKSMFGDNAKIWKIAQELARDGALVFLNGAHCASISNLHIQFLAKESLIENALETRIIPTECILSQIEALKTMQTLWSNNVYATCKIIGSNQFAIAASFSKSNFEQKKLVSFNKPKLISNSAFVSFDSLGIADKIDILMLIISNPGGMETFLNFDLDKQNIADKIKRAIEDGVLEGVDSKIIELLLPKLNSINYHQRGLSFVTKEQVLELI